ncbi:DUF1254 domain-containing protein [Psychrobacillus sp. NPDC058041]|uniref:DUF1254 domain-containing protein n=1 Tax=Psychrobacillus sp. NPDC058041 TaxID=3346310 RepID=UPI0036DAC0FB
MYTPCSNNMWLRPLIDWERQIALFAMDAYVYGFPLLLMDLTRRKGLLSLAQKNKFYHQKELSTPQFTEVVRPNVDTLYSSAWLNLNDGPLLLQIPNTNNRYYLLPMLDAYSNVFASIGARTTETAEQQFIIVGPRWHGFLPLNTPIIAAPTNTVWITGRTQTNGPQDYSAVHDIQNKYKLRRLYLTKNINPLSDNEIVISDQTPTEILASMDAPTFFQLMMKLMYKNPPYPAIQSSDITFKLYTLGLIPTNEFNFYKLHPSIQKALSNAIRNGPNYIQDSSKQFLNNININGWSMPINDIGYYGSDYWKRAVVAMNLFGANIPQDSVYAYNFVDNNNHYLDGRFNYKIRFDSSNLPPTNAFWSITLYNSNGFLVENQLNRYAISPHLGNLKWNEDGSLHLFVQHTSPGREKESNWLPSPLGSYNLLLRIYWPKTNVLNGQWHPPMVIRGDSNLLN